MDGFYKLKPRGYYNHHTRKERDSVYDLDPYIANGEFIKIGDDNVCNICNNHFMHKKVVKSKDGLEEVQLITSHLNCRKIAQKIKKKQDEIQQLKLSLEWDIFLSNDSA